MERYRGKSCEPSNDTSQIARSELPIYILTRKSFHEWRRSSESRCGIRVFRSRPRHEFSPQGRRSGAGDRVLAGDKIAAPPRLTSSQRTLQRSIPAAGSTTHKLSSSAPYLI
jgi:hypothetical protein